MRLEIVPAKGVMGIDFGSSPDAVRSAFRGEHKAFRRSPETEFPSDYFPGLGVFAYYEAGGLVALEFARPAVPYLNGTDLLEAPYSAGIKLVRSLDPTATEQVGSLISKGLGIGLYAPLAKEDASARVESVIVFNEGYYD